jgi:NTP pyrophosphatase (non-canonical NTP hydrolase)
MTLDEYQQHALKTAYHDPKYKDTLMDQTIWVMGIAGEAGEVVEKWKKVIAYQEGKLTSEDRELFKKELGDVVWYIAVMAHSLGFTFEEVMQLNVRKLRDRQKRDVIKGAGDVR